MWTLRIIVSETVPNSSLYFIPRLQANGKPRLGGKVAALRCSWCCCWWDYWGCCSRDGSWGWGRRSRRQQHRLKLGYGRAAAVGAAAADTIAIAISPWRGEGAGAATADNSYWPARRGRGSSVSSHPRSSEASSASRVGVDTQWRKARSWAGV